MKSLNHYHGYVVGATGEGPDGMICVEEHIPPDVFPLPEYISQRGSYTEMDCRFLCKELAEIIQTMHREGMAHRNLHMENVLSDIFVRKGILLYSKFAAGILMIFRRSFVAIIGVYRAK